jgi:DedD protein
MEDKLKEMKQQNDLSDIVLEKGRTGGTEKMKKILLYAASLILLFLVALVAMKLFNETPQKQENNLAQIGNKAQKSADESVDQISQKLEDTNKLFQQEPIIDESAETDLKFEEMVRKLKAQDSSESQPQTEEMKEAKTLKSAPKKEHVAVEETPMNAKNEFSKKVDQITKKITKKHNDSLTLATKEVKKHVPLAPKVIKPKVIQKPKKPVVVSKPAHEVIATSRMTTEAPVQKLATLSGYFIQVGATANSFPNRRYLQKIKNAGYDYIVHSVMIKGRKIKKILIGPFASKSTARRKLSDVRAKINASAYIYRMQ